MWGFGIFDFWQDYFAPLRRHSLVQGILLISFGLVILFFPQLLVALVASFFIMSGVLLLASAWLLRQAGKFGSGQEKEFFDLW